MAGRTSMSTLTPSTGTSGVSNPSSSKPTAKPIHKLPSVTIRFAGDSGDGMQLAGMQFTDTSALIGNDISTLPDFPAEIRAPAGTLAGVSGYQIQFSSSDIYTPGDECDALVAMNPAALRTNLRGVKKGGMIIVNSDAFAAGDLKKAGYKANPPPGTYRKITGNEAVVIGMVAASKLAGKDLFYASYPITPASDILHGLADLKNFRVGTLQAEDEICAMGAAIGAAFGGSLAATGTSGPGLALKSEAIGLAVMTELPVVIINVQRGGPSTGLPTKTEQADLLQALYGRNGECPVPIIAASSPSDCFFAAIEAFTIATKYMTPVVLMSDGYIANGAEPWMIPDVSEMPEIEIKHPDKVNDEKGFMPYLRNEDGTRPWAIPGTPGLEHRIGGLEKQDVTGNVSYDPLNHEHMVRLRAAKIANIKPAGDAYIWTGPKKGDALLIGWGGTYGAIKAAVLELKNQGVRASACHIRYLNPLPADLGERIRGFSHIIVPELNLGQLRMIIRAKYLVDAKGINKVRGQPFTINELTRAVRAIIEGTTYVEKDETKPPEVDVPAGG